MPCDGHAPGRDVAGLQVHMIGIGGSGMSGMGALLLDMGASVSGSDLVPFQGMGQLVAGGAVVTIGHMSDLAMRTVDLVVVSAAIPDTNPELIAARRAGTCVVTYAELLGLLMRGRRGMAVAGTHGKSTTTAMCAYICRHAGLDPTFLVGARSDQLGGSDGSASSGLGAGPHVIVEACEFNRSFLDLAPMYAAVLNIETDHVDCFDTFDDILDAFALFCGRVDRGGLVVCNGDDPNTRRAVAMAAACGSATAEHLRHPEDAAPVRAARRLSGRVDRLTLTGAPARDVAVTAHSTARGPGRGSALRVLHGSGTGPHIETFGFGDGVDWRAVNLRDDRGRYAFDVTLRGAHLLTTRLAIPGRHNVANALAAIALASAAGADPGRIAAALPEFSGVWRRLTFRGMLGGASVIDDYAHHPTEIRAAIDAVRARYAPKRVLVVFQPHQASRLAAMLDDFADALKAVDAVIVPDVYGARETGEDALGIQTRGTSPALVLAIARAGGRAEYVASFDAITDRIASTARNDDVVLVMGAGDVWKVTDGLVERVCESHSA
ncbi:MAG: UDP-N-acetylmuramate--L-alanine ligase [Phycisphaerae bacterium]